MKLNPELIKKILVEIEENSGGDGYGDFPVIDGYTNEEVHYHIRKMEESGLLKTDPVKPNSDQSRWYLPVDELTSKGHEFLSLARSNKFWAQAKEQIKEKGVGWTIDIAMSIMKALS